MRLALSVLAALFVPAVGVAETNSVAVVTNSVAVVTNSVPSVRATVFGRPEGWRISTKTYKLNHVNATEVAEKFNEVWGGDFGQQWKVQKMAVAFEESNTLMLTAPGQILEACEKTLQELDVEAKQVYIEARFVELSNNVFHDLGIDWSMLDGMKGSAMLGLMKMDTVVVNPFERDMALFSYDRIYAMGNDTIFLEMYDTRLDRTAAPEAAEKVKAAYADIPEEPVAPNWYDDIKLACSLKKKGKKDITPRFDQLTAEYVDAYLTLCREAKECDRAEKMKAAQAYTEGLLTNGGPSTDQFLNAKGREFTEKLFRETLFGTGDPE